jgi:hypothetical protein
MGTIGQLRLQWAGVDGPRKDVSPPTPPQLADVYLRTCHLVEGLEKSFINLGFHFNEHG